MPQAKNNDICGKEKIEQRKIAGVKMNKERERGRRTTDKEVTVQQEQVARTGQKRAKEVVQTINNKCRSKNYKDR